MVDERTPMSATRRALLGAPVAGLTLMPALGRAASGPDAELLGLCAKIEDLIPLEQQRADASARAQDAAEKIWRPQWDKAKALGARGDDAFSEIVITAERKCGVYSTECKWEPVAERISDLSQLVMSLTARTPAGLKAKAQVTAFWCARYMDPQEENIEDQMVASLLLDLLAMEG
jgi:hypothetical protein